MIKWGIVEPSPKLRDELIACGVDAKRAKRYQGFAVAIAELRRVGVLTPQMGDRARGRLVERLDALLETQVPQ